MYNGNHDVFLNTTALFNGQIGHIRYPTIFITNNNAPPALYDNKSNQLLARKIKRSLITAELYCDPAPLPDPQPPLRAALLLLRGRGQAPRPTR